MVTLWFKPGPNKGVMIQVLKQNAHITLSDARNAVEIERIKCKKEYKDTLIKAIEKAGGKIV